MVLSRLVSTRLRMILPAQSWPATPSQAGRSSRLIPVLAFAAALTLMTEGTSARPQEPAAPGKTQAGVAVPLPKGKKLVLKDGTFQMVRSFERRGDRVRYYSIERSDWEEIPADLVDWQATSRAEADEARSRQEMVEKLRATEIAEHTANVDVDASILLAPGVFLPDAEGLYAVEGIALQVTVLPLVQATADLKLDKKRLLTQILVPVPVVPSRHRVEIAGKRATIRLRTNQPEFYIRVAPLEEGTAGGANEDQEPNLELIRAEVKGDRRQIEMISTQITGDQTAKRKSISIERWKVAKRVYRVTLSQALEPGEYVLAEILPEGMNLYVWDFGVDSARGPSPARRSPN